MCVTVVIHFKHIQIRQSIITKYRVIFYAIVQNCANFRFFNPTELYTCSGSCTGLPPITKLWLANVLASVAASNALPKLLLAFQILLIPFTQVVITVSDTNASEPATPSIVLPIDLHMLDYT